MKRISVFGAGRVGALIARDLAADPGLEVHVADRSAAALERLTADVPVRVHRLDLGECEAIREVAGMSDVAVGAVPGALGFRLVETLIDAGTPAVDISFFSEDPFLLDAAARERGVPVVVDSGVAPGISNLLAGRAAAELEPLESIRILVGGLPLAPVAPWGYRAVFSPADVLEEYVRPSRFRVDGAEIVAPALSDVELVEFPGIGTLEAFLTDGLRTLLATSPARTLVEKTLRWPGHADRVRLLRDTGFFDTEPIDLGGAEVAPRDLTLALLGEQWALGESEEEFTLLRVEAIGIRGARRERIRWDLLDRTDPATGATSMARTSGFPAAIVARLLAEGRWNQPGVYAPEELGARAEVAERVLSELARRGIRVRREATPLDPE
ncbi:MAG TPA: saccharopine dehydrogenase C-terminal domain-containing protein [Gemmatimonadota bacterium]|nr:saccharopine dehydrogenase C-terminal domain-containing protein [Gemmatimonadota bacterium]